jgi:hypothetical protein
LFFSSRSATLFIITCSFMKLHCQSELARQF